MSELTYLFDGIYQDGTEFRQNKKDVSVTDPQRSSFFDVKLDEVETFCLRPSGRGRWTGPANALVNLSDGSFEVNGVRFECGDPRVHIPPDARRRLIFFRRHWQTISAAGGRTHEMAYFIGWQAAVDGKNLQQTICLR